MPEEHGSFCKTGSLWIIAKIATKEKNMTGARSTGTGLLTLGHSRPIGGAEEIWGWAAVAGLLLAGSNEEVGTRSTGGRAG